MPTTDFEPGSTFAGYLIEAELGSGGMGTVFKVRHPELKKSFALKILPAWLIADPSFAARFRREMEIVSQLDHPNIVTATDGGDVDGQIWFVMTYVRGTDAQHAIADHQHGLPPELVVHIIEEVAAALDYAHGQDILHRDIKPANILLALPKVDGTQRVYLSDFGIAKAIDDAHPLTSTGQGPMTLDYASPEQIRGDRLDRRTDVYSLGATMFALLTGRVPFPVLPSHAKMLHHLEEPPPRPTSVTRSVPAGFDAVVARAMAKDPAERFDTCGKLAEAAREAVDGGRGIVNASASVTSASQATVPATLAASLTDRTYHPTPEHTVTTGGSVPKHRRRAPMILAALAILTVAAGGTWWVRSDSGTATGGVAATSQLSGGSTDTPVTSADDNVAGVTDPGAGRSPVAGATPLGDLMVPAPEDESGTVAGSVVAGAPAYHLAPKDCPQGRQEIAVATDGSYERITGNIQLDESAPSDTRTRFTATADGVALDRPQVLSPTEGASFDLNVRNVQSLVITLETLGQGSCDNDDYLVFFTSSVAHPNE